MGEHDLRFRSSTEEDVKVQRWFVHENYRRTARGASNDVAILKLSKKVTFNEHVKPICLPAAKTHIDGGHGTIAGWGKTAEKSFEGSNIMREVVLPVWGKKKCADYGKGLINTENEFCAAIKGKDSCQVIHSTINLS